MTFASPAAESGDYVKIADLVGALVILTPLEHIQSFTTNFGDTPAIRINIVNLDEGTEHDDVLVFNKAIISSLKNNIGAQVLARIGLGVAKPGKSAPYILLDATTDTEAVTKATAYLQAKATAGISAPAPKADTGNLSPEAVAALAGVADPNSPALQALIANLSQNK